ncbi:CSN-associated deubiquitinating enzyme Ubp12 [Orbilia brochopaga]|uniref:CSN-associated deubiquitinating enzyme Ubp12 n=1 Tax=Orbilia brochopaga TaxID=3140254 RepID=A0AAV9UH13_9PEZI
MLGMAQFGVDDFWKLQHEVKELKASQSAIMKRLQRIERRDEEATRIKSLWKSPNLFPTLLSSSSSVANQAQTNGVPSSYHQSSRSETTNLHFDDLDAQPHIEPYADLESELPRRGASRANSVRFDDAIQNHWINDPHDSVEDNYFPASRSISQLGGHMLNLGVPLVNSSSSHSAVSKPPKIEWASTAQIACRLNPFAEESFTAYISSASVDSVIDFDIVSKLNLRESLRHRDNGKLQIQLSLYFFESDILSSSSSDNNMSKVTVEFTVLVTEKDGICPSSIVMGNDILMARQADISFSRQQLDIQLDDGTRAAIRFAGAPLTVTHPIPEKLVNSITPVGTNPSTVIERPYTAQSIGRKDSRFTRTFQEKAGSSPGTPFNGNHGFDFTSSQIKPSIEPTLEPPQQQARSATEETAEERMGQGSSAILNSVEDTQSPKRANAELIGAHQPKPMPTSPWSLSSSAALSQEGGLLEPKSPLQNLENMTHPAPQPAQDTPPTDSETGKSDANAAAKPEESQKPAEQQPRKRPGMKILRPTRLNATNSNSSQRTPSSSTWNVPKSAIEPISLSRELGSSEEKIDAALRPLPPQTPSESNRRKSDATWGSVRPPSTNGSNGSQKKYGTVKETVSNPIGGATAFSWMSPKQV